MAPDDVFLLLLLLLFFVLNAGDLTAQEYPPPGICHPRPKKLLMPGGQPGGGGELGAGGIDWCIILLSFLHFSRAIDVISYL